MEHTYLYINIIMYLTEERRMSKTKKIHNAVQMLFPKPLWSLTLGQGHQNCA